MILYFHQIHGGVEVHLGMHVQNSQAWSDTSGFTTGLYEFVLAGFIRAKQNLNKTSSNLDCSAMIVFNCFIVVATSKTDLSIFDKIKYVVFIKTTLTMSVHAGSQDWA